MKKSSILMPILALLILLSCQKEVYWADRKIPADLLAEIESQMVKVAGGSFEMGCPADTPWPCRPESQPRHQVQIGDFYMAKFEVTNELAAKILGKDWISLMDAKAEERLKNCPQCPLEGVVPISIRVIFLKHLNSQAKYQYRLPTEAEWEYAARGGQLSKGYQFPGGNALRQVAWYAENSNGQTQPVGQKQPNELGLYDMAGNVEEWCSDWYAADYYAQGNKVDPTGPADGRMQVVRGGSVISTEAECATTFRNTMQPAQVYAPVGFRLVRDAE